MSILSDWIADQNYPKMKTLIYLATPYSHPDESVRIARFEAVNNAAATMMRSGLHVFSPISHTHPIALAGDLPLNWEFWEAYDRAVLSACGKLVVLMLAGWEQSRGVTAEIAIAREMGLPVEFLVPTNFQNIVSGLVTKQKTES